MWKVPMEFGVIKHMYMRENGGNICRNRELFKEFVKIGVFRIFRCSDFNSRNVQVGLRADPGKTVFGGYR